MPNSLSQVFLFPPIIKRLFRPLVFALLCTFLLAACDPGSTITIRPEGNTCLVSMRPNDKVFDIDMTLSCDENGQNCFEVTALSCQGEAKLDVVPIDLTIADGCPGADYCINSCSVGLEAPGRLWDMPSLLAINGCNTYAK